MGYVNQDQFSDNLYWSPLNGIWDHLIRVRYRLRVIVHPAKSRGVRYSVASSFLLHGQMCLLLYSCSVQADKLRILNARLAVFSGYIFLGHTCTWSRQTNRFSQKINPNMHQIWLNTAIQLYFKTGFKLNTSTIKKVRQTSNITGVCGNDLD